MKQLIHYVEFLYPGAFWARTEIRKVNHRDANRIRAPPGCYGFRFFDGTMIRSRKEAHIARPKHYSGFYYFGKILTLEEIRRELPEKKLLIDNMESEGLDRVVRTRLGNFVALALEDVVLPDKYT